MARAIQCPPVRTWCGTWHPTPPIPALLPEEDAHFSPCHCNLIKSVYVQVPAEPAIPLEKAADS